MDGWINQSMTLVWSHSQKGQHGRSLCLSLLKSVSEALTAGNEKVSSRRERVFHHLCSSQKALPGIVCSVSKCWRGQTCEPVSSVSRTSLQSLFLLGQYFLGFRIFVNFVNLQTLPHHTGIDDR